MMAATGLLEPGPTARIVIGLLLFVALVIAAPLLISTTGINAQAAREQLASAIQPQIDQLAMQAGLSWDGHYLSEVDQLLRQGQISQARKLYHDKTSATWDEADQAMGDWAGTVLIKKLEILQAQFHRSQNQGGAK